METRQAKDSEVGHRLMGGLLHGERWTAVCRNASLEECQEEVILWSSIAAPQLLPR